jgi:hypothetical protein
LLEPQPGIWCFSSVPWQDFARGSDAERAAPGNTREDKLYRCHERTCGSQVREMDKWAFRSSWSKVERTWVCMVNMVDCLEEVKAQLGRGWDDLYEVGCGPCF